MKIYVIRHLPVLVSGVCYGQSDVKAQLATPDIIADIKQQLPKNHLIYSSPLQRCRQLAAKLLPDQKVIVDARLKELHFGDWELQPWGDIERDALDEWAQDPLNFCMPRGESFTQLISRVDNCLADMAKSSDVAGEGKPVVVVSHGGVIRALAVICRGASVAAALNLKAPFGSVNVFEYPFSGKGE